MMGVLACASASCSLLVDTSDLSGGPLVQPNDGGDDAADGQVSGRFEAGADAHAVAEAGADGDADAALPVDAGPRKNSCGDLLFGTPLTLFNGDFELGCANGFTSYATTPVNDSTAPSNGANACKLCYGSGPDGYFLTATVVRDVVPGETYEAVACVRDAPGADAGAAVHVEIGNAQDVSFSNAIAVGPTYATVRKGWDVQQAHDRFTINIRAATKPDSCFLVDDLTLSLIKDAGAH